MPWPTRTAIDKWAARWERVGIWWKLLLAIIVGFLLFVAWPLRYHESVCPTQKPIAWHIDGNKYSTDKNYESSGGPRLFLPKQEQQTYQLNARAENAGENGPASLLCDELRITDVGIVFFTYCLVVVGWFTLRSSEQTARKAERAYMFCGGLFGRPKKDLPPEQQRAEQYIHSASNYEPPWRMMIHNFGRTPGTVLKVVWGVLPKAQFDENALISDFIERPEVKKMLTIIEVREVFAPMGDKAVPYRHVQPGRKYEEVFFGKIWYKDVFNANHFSTFALLHDKHHSTPIGGAFSDDTQ